MACMCPNAIFKQVFSLTSSQYAEVEAVFNRANHLARDTEVSSPSVHSEVFRDVYEVLHGSDAFDYAVIDEALWSRQRSILLQTLSMSTVWFDVTNGRVFAAHHDDGLVQPAFPLVGDVSFTFHIHFAHFFYQSHHISHPEGILVY